MKTILSLRRHHYLKTVGIFLITAVLIAGVVSCTPTETYELTMAADPAAGGTATDETNASPYAEGTVVDIKAVAAPCYRFVDWTAPTGGIGNTTAAETTFTMPARDVTVTANFELVPPDHFKFYGVDYETAPYVGKDVQLVDQFGAINATVGYAVSFGNPVGKVHGDVPTPIADMNRHYTLYDLEYEGEPQSWQVTVHNQFQDDVELTVIGPFYLAVPTQKGDHEEWKCLNHYLVYDAYGPVVNDEVLLKDQFTEETVFVVYEPYYFANPVEKTLLPGGSVTPIEKEDEHYVFYDISGEPIEKMVQIDNQFGPQTLDLLNPEYLAVPSQKIAWEQPLDHFKCYWATWADEPPPTFPAVVQLEDQFIADWLGEPLDATVLDPYLFANPVNKGHDEVWTPISNWNDHYTFYNLYYEEMTPIWWVQVSNQFGINQELFVAGPYYLAVPTQKGLHDPPVGLDHFLVYEVLPGPPIVGAEVFLWDQFTEQPAMVYEPTLFANPVQKIYGTDVTDIKHDDHLVFYRIDGGMFYEEWLPIDNQFDPQVLTVGQGDYDILGVPSQKIEWSLAD